MKQFVIGIIAVILVVVGAILVSQVGENDDTSNDLNLVEQFSPSADPIWAPIILPTPTPTQTPTPPPLPPLPTPTPTITPKPAPAPAEGLVESDVVSIIHEVFGVNAGAALSVAWCESQFNPNAIGDHGDSLGLFQINEVHWFWLDASRLFEPLYNTQIAFQLSKGCTDDEVCGPGGSDWSSWAWECQP